MSNNSFGQKVKNLAKHFFAVGVLTKTPFSVCCFRQCKVLSTFLTVIYILF